MRIRTLLERASILTAGLFLKRAVNYPFDYVLYPLMLLWLGYLWGGLVMILLATVLNLLIIWAYDWSKTDWLLIETLKEVRHGDSENRWQKIVRALLRKGDIPAFFVLSLDDPVTTMLYLRHGVREYNGMSARDWWIFVASTVVSNLYWILGIAVVLESITWVIAQ